VTDLNAPTPATSTMACECGTADAASWISTAFDRSIELLPDDRSGEAPHGLHWYGRDAAGDFTGFVQWIARRASAATSSKGALPAVSSACVSIHHPLIARESRDSSRVTLRDGREMLLSAPRSRQGQPRDLRGRPALTAAC